MTSGVQPRSRFRPRAGRAGARPGKGRGRGAERGESRGGAFRAAAALAGHTRPLSRVVLGGVSLPRLRPPQLLLGHRARDGCACRLPSAGYSDANGLKALRNLKGASNETNISITNATQQLVLAYSFVLGKVAGEVTERTVSTQPRSHTKETRPGTFYS